MKRVDVAKFGSDYIRNGTAAVFCFIQPHSGMIARKLEVHYTPRHGSWFDIAQISINIMTRECLNRRIGSLTKLREELDAWNNQYNKNPSPICWQFQNKESRIKLRRLYPDIDQFRKERDDR